MRIFLLPLVLLSASVSAEVPDKVVSCPRFPDGTGVVVEGTLKDGAWRVEEFIFNPKDFERDEPNLVHQFTVGYIHEDGSTVATGERYAPIRYRVSPTNLVFYHPVKEETYTIDRTDLTVTFDLGFFVPEVITLKCTISDLEARAF